MAIYALGSIFQTLFEFLTRLFASYTKDFRLCWKFQLDFFAQNQKCIHSAPLCPGPNPWDQTYEGSIKPKTNPTRDPANSFQNFLEFGPNLEPQKLDKIDNALHQGVKTWAHKRSKSELFTQKRLNLLDVFMTKTTSIYHKKVVFCRSYMVYGIKTSVSA